MDLPRCQRRRANPGLGSHAPDGWKDRGSNLFPPAEPAAGKAAAEIKLAKVLPGKYELQQRCIGYHHNDAYAAYLEMGSPAQLTRAQEKFLREACQGEPESSRPVEIDATGEFHTTLPMKENEVVLLELVPVRAQ